ncbi:MAG: hypothetical protein IBX50_03505 [Marinospirillum sp.]|nr:hypothetical protein [Marinospirillum sp.]
MFIYSFNPELCRINHESTQHSTNHSTRTYRFYWHWADGAIVHQQLRDLIRHCQIICLCLADTQTVEQVVMELREQLQPGQGWVAAEIPCLSTDPFDWIPHIHGII